MIERYDDFFHAGVIAITKPVITGVQSADEFIAYVARVSNPNNQLNKATAPKLIKYLIDNNHWSPFEMVSVTMEIQTTRDIGRQILRHRSFSFQEFSQRYAEVNNVTILREARLQDTKNRQNSLDTDDARLKEEWNMKQAALNTLAQDTYKWALEKGIAKEQARAVLPEGNTPTRMYMSGSVRSWIHFIEVRADHTTQKEHRLIAEACRVALTYDLPSIARALNW